MAAGRPRTITNARILDAGIAMTLPQLTVAGLARRLGVTVAALHRHVGTLEKLHIMVAEEIFARWRIPEIAGQPIADYLLEFADSLRALAHGNPGIARFIAQVSTRAPLTLVKIDAHQAGFARAYGLSPTQTGWLLSVVAQHAVAVADLVHVPGGRPGRDQPGALRARDDLRNLNRVEDVIVPYDEIAAFRLSMRALVVGALQVVTELP